LARKLLNEHDYDPSLVKVLLGGWSAWKDANAGDKSAYPIEP
jgi:hypothetical protein